MAAWTEFGFGKASGIITGDVTVTQGYGEWKINALPVDHVLEITVRPKQLSWMAANS